MSNLLTQLLFDGIEVVEHHGEAYEHHDDLHGRLLVVLPPQHRQLFQEKLMKVLRGTLRDSDACTHEWLVGDDPRPHLVEFGRHPLLPSICQKNVGHL